MKIKLTAIITALVLMLFATIPAGAEVYTVDAPTNGDTIYIAGDPDMYPIEYYDTDDKEYKGILPQMYKKISEDTGIDFSYINSGTVNEQYRLAKNDQVEIVSAHAKGDVDDLAEEVHILTYRKGDKEIELCVGFTSIASEDLVRTVTTALRSVSSEQVLRLAVETAAADPAGEFPLWLVFVAGALLIACVVLILIVIKHRKKAKEARENKLADSLTGIGNSLYFEQWYQNFISPASSSLYYIAYIGIDVQRILQYADSAVSEEIQIYAASEIASEARETDFCARVSDGRFVLAFETPVEDQAKEFIEQLLSQLNRFNSDVMVKYHIHFQAGVFHLNAPNIPCEKAIFNARQGFYRARELNEPYVFADAKLLKREEYVNNLRKRLRDALDKKEFRLYVQYIFDGKGRVACGAEALSRWDSPEQGMISPTEYIFMLETAEMIDELDFYILGECCRTLHEWKNTKKGNLWLSCNMTRITLSDENFAERFKAIVGQYDFDIDKLVIEITEDAFAASEKQVVDSIGVCKQMGCRIALDDFGCGYSSVKDLYDYPIDIIKIDRVLVGESRSEKGKRLLSGIVKLSHFLGIKALCEGVEVEEEMAASTEADCDYIQGYLLARTNPVDEPSAERDIIFA
ncbi:MAG: EAL domain-containing protein [Ruminococcus sp.]|nr:EAL domain-containing protein [Ruminococcus sp.]